MNKSQVGKVFHWRSIICVRFLIYKL